MAQRRRSNYGNSPTGLLVLFASVANPWLRTAAEDERRTAGRLLWGEAAPAVQEWALQLSRRLRNDADTARLLAGIELLVSTLGDLNDAMAAATARPGELPEA